MGTSGFADLESLSRERLLAVAHEYMLSGMLGSPGGSPTLAGADMDPEAGTAIIIEEWMGSSPVYTKRMRQLMGIEGHDVPAIMKALQLDMGFVHGFMNVAYRVDPANSDYGEFWLLHCGALLMVEPAGEAAVFHMCHTIEDPTFDATALATNSRARIRPIHRPPRTPADRHPHCHSAIEISDNHEPVGQIPLAEYIEALPLARIPNAVTGGPFRAPRRLQRSVPCGIPAEPADRRRVSGRGPRVPHAASPQGDGKRSCSGRRTDKKLGQVATDEGWVLPAWIVGERLAKAAELGEGTEAVGRLLALTPVLPPGSTVTSPLRGIG